MRKPTLLVMGFHHSWEQWPPGGTRLAAVLTGAGWDPGLVTTLATSFSDSASLAWLGSTLAGWGASTCFGWSGCCSTSSDEEFRVISGSLHLGFAVGVGVTKCSVFFTSTSAAATGLASLAELLSFKEEFSGFASADLGSTPLLLIFPSISVGFVPPFSSLVKDDVRTSWGWDGGSTCFAEDRNRNLV